MQNKSSKLERILNSFKKIATSFLTAATITTSAYAGCPWLFSLSSNGRYLAFPYNSKGKLPLFESPFEDIKEIKIKDLMQGGTRDYEIGETKTLPVARYFSNTNDKVVFMTELDKDIDPEVMVLTPQNRYIIDNAYFPKLSPNGRFVFFSRRKLPNHAPIYRLDLSNLETTSLGDEGIVTDCSPDSENICYISKNFDLKVSKIDGSDKRRADSLQPNIYLQPNSPPLFILFNLSPEPYTHFPYFINNTHVLYLLKFPNERDHEIVLFHNHPEFHSSIVTSNDFNEASPLFFGNKEREVCIYFKHPGHDLNQIKPGREVTVYAKEFLSNATTPEEKPLFTLTDEIPMYLSYDNNLIDFAVIGEKREFAIIKRKLSGDYSGEIVAE